MREVQLLYTGISAALERPEGPDCTPSESVCLDLSYRSPHPRLRSVQIRGMISVDDARFGFRIILVSLLRDYLVLIITDLDLRDCVAQTLCASTPVAPPYRSLSAKDTLHHTSSSDRSKK
jgi:hypothetical protein